MKEGMLMTDGYSNFMKQVNSKFGIDLTLYKEAQMRRRLTSLRNNRNYTDFNTYFKALETDEQLRNEFFDRITINVSEFYRNPRRWDVLREKVFPFLTKQKRRLNIWSAACSTGEEPYSLAIMLKEHFPHVRASILATDIDDNILARAKQGIYAKQSLKDLPQHKKEKYFTFKNNQYYFNDDLKGTVQFKKHDLLKDTYPKNYDLIVCRNVLIYFTDEAKDKIYKNLSNSLVEDGILFVGSTEQIFNPNQYEFSLFDTFFYKKSHLVNE